MRDQGRCAKRARHLSENNNVEHPELIDPFAMKSEHFLL